MRIFLFLLLFWAFPLQAQITKNYKDTSLQVVLKELSLSYDLIFSFSDAVVKNKSVSMVLNNTPLKKVLLTLEKVTNLTFKKISKRQVVVSVPDIQVEVCGYLYDKITNVPLSFATISVVNEKTGTIANDDGFFQLGLIDENAVIKIEYVGYKDEVVDASFFSASKCPRIPLLVQSTSLEEILIVEYLTTGIDKNIDGSFLISSNELGILPGQSETDVLKTVQLIPGINSMDESISAIEIRGGSADQNLIVWDDITMYNTAHFFGMISAFNPNVIDKVKVYKGGADPKYGNRVSGIIDIASDKEVPEEFEGGVGVNGTHADIFLKVPVDNRVGLVVSGRRSYTDYFETPTYNVLSEKVFQNTKIVETPIQTIIITDPIDIGDEEEEEEEEEEDEDGEEVVERIVDNNFFFYDVSAKLIIDISENDTFLASGIYTKNDLAFVINADEDKITDDLKIQNKGASFSWTGSKMKHLHHSIKTYYSKYDSDYLFTEREQTTVEEQSVRKNVVEDVGLDINIGYDFDRKNSLSIGYQFSNDKVFYTVTRESDFANIIDESDRVRNNVNTVYTNYKFLPKNKSFINVGIRASHHSIVQKLFIEPRVNIEYPLSNFLRVKATAEHRCQTISQLIEFEDTQLRLENKIWLHSDDKVPVLKSNQFSGGLLFSQNGLHIEVDGYHKDIKGLTSITNGFNTVEDEFSTGKSAIVGVDILLKKKFENLQMWAGYTYNDIKYTFSEIQEASFSGNNDITHNFRISNTYELDKWEFSLGWLWRSGAPYTDADLVDGEIKFGNTNARRLPEYHRLDVSAIYEFEFGKTKRWSGQLGMSLQNVYNRQVPLSISYRIDDAATTKEIELNRLQQQSLGSMPNVMMRLKF